ncbi:PE family protein [Mycobacterium spongiae]|uniref:PE family protein n=1 Tax=Mycobacterium spongiae TaxID=886343 RepID=UPI001FE9B3F1|nr:PE family protein [Mycobacterium spongiae]
MSFVWMSPDVVTTAAGDLAGIRSALDQANAAAAVATTQTLAPAADEVSAAVTALFTSQAEEYQGLSAQVGTYHEHFVSLLNGSVAAYAGAEYANAQRNAAAVVNAPAQALLGHPVIANAVAGVTVGSGALPGPGAGGLASEGAALAAIPAGGTPLTAAPAAVAGAAARGAAAIEGAAPLLSSRVAAGVGAATESLAAAPATFGAALAAPALALPAASQSIGGAYDALFATTVANLDLIGATWEADPTPFLSQIIANQQGYVFTIGSSLTNAAGEVGAGLAALPAAYESAFQALLAGDIGGALTDLATGYRNLFATLGDAVADLFPITAIPGEIVRNIANVLFTATDISFTANIDPFSIAPTDNTVDFGLPLALAIQALGSPVSTIGAVYTVALRILLSAQSGNIEGVIGSLIDAPATIANGFLNGQAVASVPLNAGGVPVVLNLPFTGILAPQTTYTATVPGGETVSIGGTPIGGLVPALHYASEQLAGAITPK